MKILNPVITDDGSHTIKLADNDEHYHSTYGALSESRHVFIEAGLKYLWAKGISHFKILEIGLGTGLNGLLTACEASDKGLQIEYTSLEPFPLEESVWRKLNYPALLNHKEASGWYRTIHESSWEKPVTLGNCFKLLKHRIKMQDFQGGKAMFNLIYFDAFSPDIQPELWGFEIFNSLSFMTEKAGVMVTYSAKGSVRRALESAGFMVERIPGPKGKRQMIRAIKG
jgi:tRNA U34 5-methylaminomethyl-2-thiouridine-forming methyltransferase MnmC